LNKVLNLVLDQLDRTQDLYYQVKVFSSHAFEMNRAGEEFQISQKIEIPSVMGGGTPSCMTFYRNPQFLISIDKDKFKNPALINNFFDIQVTYKTNDDNTSFKLFLCHAAKGVMRVAEVNESMVNKSLKDDPYRNAFYT